MCGGAAAAPGRLAPPAVRMLQRGHHGVIGDGAKLVGEGAVEDQDVDDKDPLADGGQVLEEEAFVDEEDATCGGSQGKVGNPAGGPRLQS